MIIRYQAEACGLEFPQELSDYIFETLGSDSSSLKNCSLVCRAWLYATRTHLFRHVILTPKNIASFKLLIADSPSTVHSHIRKLELVRIDCLNRQVISNFTSTLTHLHLRDMAFNAFIDILDIICSFSYLRSVALDGITVETSSIGKSAHIQNKVLPSSVNSVRYRGGHLRTFLSWLLHHTNVPKIARLYIGPIDQGNIFEVGKYLRSVGPALRHLSVSFDIGHNTHHSCTFQNHDSQTMLTTEHLEVSSIARHYRKIFGFNVCPNIGALTGLHSLHLDSFIHFEDHAQNSALIWGPRILASTSAVNLQEVILGVSLRKAGDLDGFNIRWDFFDEMFASMGELYGNLVSVKFEITGTVNMDGIASLIRSRLPCCEKRGLLRFYREN